MVALKVATSTVPAPSISPSMGDAQMSPPPVGPLLLHTPVSSGELHTAGPAIDCGLRGGSDIPHPHSTKGLRILGNHHSCSEPEPAIATSWWRLRSQRKSVPEGLWLISSNSVASGHQEEVAEHSRRKVLHPNQMWLVIMVSEKMSSSSVTEGGMDGGGDITVHCELLSEKPFMGAHKLRFLR